MYIFVTDCKTCHFIKCQSQSVITFFFCIYGASCNLSYRENSVCKIKIVQTYYTHTTVYKISNRYDAIGSFVHLALGIYILITGGE